MLERTQISLRTEQLRAAKRKAADLGVSLAEYIRRLVDRDLGTDEGPRFDISKIAGIGDSGGSDVAKYKDEYLAEAVEVLHPRR
jgi:hypothetical protein